MSKVVKFIAVMGMAAGVAAATAVALADEQTRSKVAEAVGSVKKAAREVVSTVADGIGQARRDAAASSVEKNQAWAEEQWEALGI